jgi:hypothetical protein
VVDREVVALLAPNHLVSFPVPPAWPVSWQGRLDPSTTDSRQPEEDASRATSSRTWRSHCAAVYTDDLRDHCTCDTRNGAGRSHAA